MRRLMRNNCRRAGLATGALTLGYRMAQRVMTLDVTQLVWLDVSTINCLDSPDPRFDFRFLASSEVETFCNEPANNLASSDASRILAGRDFCFAALDGAHLAAYAWFALGSIEASNNRGRTERSGVALSFPNDVAFLYKGMTLPGYRGLGLYGAVNSQGLEALSAYGVRSILSTMDWTNRAAKASCDKLGYKTLGRVWRWGWGSMLFAAAPASAKARGVLFDRQAVVAPRPAPGPVPTTL